MSKFYKFHCNRSWESDLWVGTWNRCWIITLEDLESAKVDESMTQSTLSEITVDIFLWFCRNYSQCIHLFRSHSQSVWPQKCVLMPELKGPEENGQNLVWEHLHPTSYNSISAHRTLWTLPKIKRLFSTDTVLPWFKSMWLRTFPWSEISNEGKKILYSRWSPINIADALKTFMQRTFPNLLQVENSLESLYLSHTEIF